MKLGGQYLEIPGGCEYLKITCDVRFVDTGDEIHEEDVGLYVDDFLDEYIGNVTITKFHSECRYYGDNRCRMCSYGSCPLGKSDDM